jgi:hypothetical protein
MWDLMVVHLPGPGDLGKVGCCVQRNPSATQPDPLPGTWPEATFCCTAANVQTPSLHQQHAVMAAFYAAEDSPSSVNPAPQEQYATMMAMQTTHGVSWPADVSAAAHLHTAAPNVDVESVE